ncbi:MAG: hypothetical protein ABWY00_16675 [Dongiaceae bacterium]
MTTHDRPLHFPALPSTGLACVAAMALLVLAGCADNGTPDSSSGYQNNSNGPTRNRVLLEHGYTPEGSPFRRTEHGRN